MLPRVGTVQALSCLLHHRCGSIVPLLTGAQCVLQQRHSVWLQGKGNTQRVVTRQRGTVVHYVCVCYNKDVAVSPAGLARALIEHNVCV